MNSGYVYIITNPAYPGYVKVGITQDISARLRTYQTSDPKRNYKVEYFIFHPECQEAEKRIKESMSHFAFSQKNEWFEISIDIAMNRLDESLETYNNGEWIGYKKLNPL